LEKPQFLHRHLWPLLPATILSEFVGKDGAQTHLQFVQHPFQFEKSAEKSVVTTHQGQGPSAQEKSWPGLKGVLPKPLLTRECGAFK
jgi:hypothetical protein